MFQNQFLNNILPVVNSENRYWQQVVNSHFLYVNNSNQVIWLAENYKWMWHQFIQQDKG